MSVMKSFRGKLADGEQERISLSTNNGLTGYRVTKFQLKFIVFKKQQLLIKLILVKIHY
jgi:hypothetical protein